MILTAQCCAKPKIQNSIKTVYANAEGRLFFWQMQGFDKPVQITKNSCMNCGKEWEELE